MHHETCDKFHISSLSSPVGTTKITSPECSHCARVQQSSQYSCCAPGGAWHKSCGSSNSKFLHTWSEGIKACKDFIPLVLDEAYDNDTIGEPDYSHEPGEAHERDDKIFNEMSNICVVVVSLILILLVCG